MSDKTDYKAPNPAPMYILLTFSICLCACFFFIGTVCARLWFYKGALGPIPEKFIIIPQHRRKNAQQQPAASSSNRVTVFPEIAHVTDHYPNVLPDADEESVPGPRFTTIPAIRVQDPDGDYDDAFADEFEDPEAVRRYVAEEHRISRLPVFDQDDCGDGSEFPDVPYAQKPVEALPPTGLVGTKSYLQLRLAKTSSMRKWLTIDFSYIELHEARASLLDRQLQDCVQVKPDGEAASDELMKEVVQHLCTKYPDHFRTKTKHRRKHVRNELASEDYSLARPFDCHPLVLCARLAAEDFSIFIKDDFTLQWYLQASATLFPSGFTLSTHIGKSLSSIINNPHSPMPLWDDLPVIFSHLTSPASLFTRTSTFIQTRDSKSPLASALHIPRPADFFAGNIYSLLPINLYVRHEHQSFRLLKDSGAIVMTTRTQLKKLTEMEGWREKEELMKEVRRWGEEEAEWKGRGLWMRAVRGWCEGREVWHDDLTVSGAGELTTVGGEE